MTSELHFDYIIVSGKLSGCFIISRLLRPLFSRLGYLNHNILASDTIISPADGCEAYRVNVPRSQSTATDSLCCRFKLHLFYQEPLTPDSDSRTIFWVRAQSDRRLETKPTPQIEPPKITSRKRRHSPSQVSTRSAVTQLPLASVQATSCSWSTVQPSRLEINYCPPSLTSHAIRATAQATSNIRHLTFVNLRNTYALTVDNLSALDRENGDMTRSPNDKAGCKSNDTSNSPSKDRAILQSNAVFIHDKDDQHIKPYTALYKSVRSILEHERGSPERDGTLDRTIDDLQNTRSKYQHSNGNTFLVMFTTELLGKARHIKEISVPPTEEDTAWVLRSWSDSKLHCLWSANMKSAVLPKLVSNDKAANRLLELLPNPKRPRPDMLFEYNLAFRGFTEVTPELTHAGILLECLSRIPQSTCESANVSQSSSNPPKGPQCRHHQRSTDPSAASSRPEDPGPDLKSFAFSIVLDPSMADIYVNWAERRRNDSTLYHMSLVETHAIKSAAGLKGFRRSLFSMLDWSLHERRDEVEAFLQEIRRKRGQGISIDGKERPEDEAIEIVDSMEGSLGKQTAEDINRRAANHHSLTLHVTAL
ncbi:hypothetical protein BDR22DRAFT_908037 [Usnea florida]